MVKGREEGIKGYKGDKLFDFFDEPKTTDRGRNDQIQKQE
jgi:hypothetical protein